MEGAMPGDIFGIAFIAVAVLLVAAVPGYLLIKTKLIKEDAISAAPAMCGHIEKCSRAGMILKNVRTVTLKDVTVRDALGDRLVCEKVGEVIEG